MDKTTEQIAEKNDGKEEKEECQDYIDLLKLKERIERNKKKLVKNRVKCFVRNKEYFRKMKPSERMSAILCSYSEIIDESNLDEENDFHVHPEEEHVDELLRIFKACFPDFHIECDKDPYTGNYNIDMERLDTIRMRELKKRREELTREQRDIDEELEKFKN